MLKKSKKKTTAKRFKSKRGSKSKTIIASQCARYQSELLEGVIISIDPSSGSEGSQPGYAIFSKGVLIEYGTIEIGTRSTGGLANRLFLLRDFMIKQLPTPSIVVVERCPFAYANLAASRLQQVIGVIKSTWDVPAIEVSPSSWKAHTDSIMGWGLTYKKSDPLDAVAIGACVINLAKKEAGG